MPERSVPKPAPRCFLCRAVRYVPRVVQVQRVINAPPRQVWQVLADGWLYASWVVGAPHVRNVDDHWPEPGAILHHASGAWPFLIKDITQVLQAQPPHTLVMKPNLWPLGRGVVSMHLVPIADGRTRVELEEYFHEGPLRWLLAKGQQLLLYRRNVESLRRLDDLAVHRVG